MVSRSTEQFQAAEAAVQLAVRVFRRRLENIFDGCAGEWPGVAPSYILEVALVELCREMILIADDPRLVERAGPATLKLSNALADFRDSGWFER
jgi:hypothetical protein